MNLQWVDKLDQTGPFGSIKELQNIFNSVPPGEQDHSMYHYLEGLIQGRLIHEQLGGIAAS